MPLCFLRSSIDWGVPYFSKYSGEATNRKGISLLIGTAIKSFSTKFPTLQRKSSQ